MTDDLIGYEYRNSEGLSIKVLSPTGWAPNTYVNVKVTYPDGTTEYTVRPAGVVRQTKLNEETCGSCSS